MKYCKVCLQPDTRPNIRFNDEGICPACEYFESLKTVDWHERYQHLMSVVEFGKANNASGYDCIIGVSGGKDSLKQALFVKDVLKMKPLLVCLSYPPEQLSERGAVNISNMIKLGFDCITVSLSPKVWKALITESFFKYCNWAKATEMALFSSVPRLAIAYQIPLIWWGENPALQLGELGALGKDGSDGNQLRNINTLAGGAIDWMLALGFEPKQLLQYQYPSLKDMENANLRIVYLGYFMKDWSLINNGLFSTLHGLDIRTDQPENTGDIYGVARIDEDWVGLNQMIKYYKFGFGLTTEYMNEEIRWGRKSREEAIKLIERYDGKAGAVYIESFCDYIGIDEGTFWHTVDQFVNTSLFERIQKGQYRPRFKVGVGL